MGTGDFAQRLAEALAAPDAALASTLPSAGPSASGGGGRRLPLQVRVRGLCSLASAPGPQRPRADGPQCFC